MSEFSPADTRSTGTVGYVTSLRAAPMQVHALDDDERGELQNLIDEQPLVNAVLASRLASVDSLGRRRLGGALLGVRQRGALRAAVFNGGNLLPVGGDEPAWTALAASLAQQRRVCTSIVGPAEAVTTMWRLLEAAWGSARSVRPGQPLLAIGAADPRILGDPSVREVRPEEIDSYLPAAMAMFTEELGVSPLATVNLAAYRRRVGELIHAGRAFAIFDRAGEVIFKADIGAVSAHTCQVQGVWVRPDLRGRGIGGAALATVVEQALTLAPTVSLYVNDFNAPARRMYARLGMRQVGTLSTVLF